MVVNRLRGVGPAGQQYAEISGVHDVSENSPPATSPAKSHSTSPKKVKEGAAGVLCSSLKDATTEQSIVAALSAVRAYIEDGTACARLMSAGLEVVLFEKVTAAPHPRKVCRAVSGGPASNRCSEEGGSAAKLFDALCGTASCGGWKRTYSTVRGSALYPRLHNLADAYGNGGGR